MPDPAIVTFSSICLSLVLNMFFFGEEFRITFPIVCIVGLYSNILDLFPELQTCFRSPASNNKIYKLPSFPVNRSPDPAVVFF